MLPLLNAQQEAIQYQALSNHKKKNSSIVDTGQSVTDVDIDQFFFYFEKTNRKRIEKAYSRVKFDSMLLTKND